MIAEEKDFVGSEGPGSLRSGCTVRPRFGQHPTIDLDAACDDLHGLAGKPDGSFHKVDPRLQGVFDNDDVASRRDAASGQGHEEVTRLQPRLHRVPCYLGQPDALPAEGSDRKESSTDYRCDSVPKAHGESLCRVAGVQGGPVTRPLQRPVPVAQRPG
jgi:hypothetical protein